jgi:hypothetical protein
MDPASSDLTLVLTQRVLPAAGPLDDKVLRRLRVKAPPAGGALVLR